jgi:putative transposase
LPSVTKLSEIGVINSGKGIVVKSGRAAGNCMLHYLWRAVDQDGDEIDILVQKRKDKHAAKLIFKKLLKGQQAAPIRIVTDKLRSYSAAKKELIPSVENSTQQYENNRCELSHQPSRQQESQMRKFKL